ncbi:MAG: hypothetical protein ACR2RB_11010 [Gammaproteobacteria bacterium]
MRARLTTALAAVLLAQTAVIAHAALPRVDQVSRQDLSATTARVVETLELLGSPLSEADRARLEAARQETDDEAMASIQEVLDPYCLVGVHIDEEGWLKIMPASNDPNDRRLRQHVWRKFLVKVHNEGTVTTPLEVASPHALQPDEIGESQSARGSGVSAPHSWFRWVGLKLVQDPPMHSRLSGKELEYRIVQVYSRDAGIRAADLVFRLGGGLVARGHYADISLLFHIGAASAEPIRQNPHLQGITKNGRYFVRVEPEPPVIPFQELFELKVTVYDGDDHSKRLDDVELARVDAIMTAHGHGMTTQSEVTKDADGAFRVRGMKFHMQGDGEDGLWVIRLLVRGELDDTAELNVQCCSE